MKGEKMIAIFYLLFIIGLLLVVYAFRNMGSGKMEKKDIKFVYGILTLVTAIIANMLLFATYGIDYVTMIWSICSSIIILLVYFSIYYMKYIYDGKWNDFFPVVMSVCVIVVLLVVPMIVTLDAYTMAFRLPYRYNASCNTIEETQEMLLKYEDNPSLASGLEALELKQTLSKAIKEKNNLKAEIDVWLNYPFAPFKDVLRTQLTVIQ